MMAVRNNNFPLIKRSDAHRVPRVISVRKCPELVPQREHDDQLPAPQLILLAPELDLVLEARQQLAELVVGRVHEPVGLAVPLALDLLEVEVDGHLDDGDEPVLVFLHEHQGILGRYPLPAVQLVVLGEGRQRPDLEDGVAVLREQPADEAERRFPQPLVVLSLTCFGELLREVPVDAPSFLRLGLQALQGLADLVICVADVT